MRYRLISGDNHIDLTYCPPDLWSSQAPSKWKLLVPRVEELEDGLHWFVEAQDKGMWNGVGPGFLPYQKGVFGHIDEMKGSGFEWDNRPGARPRPPAGAAWWGSGLQAHERAPLPSRLVSPLGGRRGVSLPDLVPLHGLQGPAGAGYARDGAGVHDAVAARALQPLSARRDGGA